MRYEVGRRVCFVPEAGEEFFSQDGAHRVVGMLHIASEALEWGADRSGEAPRHRTLRHRRRLKRSYAPPMDIQIRASTTTNTPHSTSTHPMARSDPPVRRRQRVEDAAQE